MASLAPRLESHARLDCPVAEACGGCPLIAQTLAAQRAEKLRMVRELLVDALGAGGDAPARAPELEVAERVHFHPALSPLAYRNRIRLRINETGEFGFFNPEKDPACAVLLPELKGAMRAITEALHPVREVVALYEHVEIRTPDLDGRAGLFLTGHNQHSFKESPRHQLSEALQGAAVVGFAGDSSQPTQRFPLTPGVFQRVPLGGFMQVNFAINQHLIASLIAGAQARGLRSAADLYCGAGNFLLPLLAAGLTGFGVEIQSQSIAAAERAASEQGLAGTWSSSDVPAWLEHAERLGTLDEIDLAIVDPPRAGLGSGVEHLLKIAPPFIAVCSCSPKTLARDVKALVDGGYLVESAELFDMFAHTRHVEVLVWLRREASSAAP